MSPVWRSPITHASGAGVLAALGIMCPAVWVLAPIGLGLYFHSLLQRSLSLRTTILMGILFGLLVSGAAVSWFWDTLPLTRFSTLGVFAQHYLVGITWSTTAVALAAPIVLFSILMRYVRPLWMLPVIAGIGWALTEWLRMGSFALMFLSPITTLDPHFSVGAFGYPLTEAPFLLQWASMGGSATLNIIAGSIAGAIAYLLIRINGVPKTYTRGDLFVGALILIIVLVPLGMRYTAPAATNTLKVALISTNAGEVIPLDPHILISLIQEAIEREPALAIVAIPERYAFSGVIEDEQERQAFYHTTFGKEDLIFIGSGHATTDDGGIYGQLSYESATDGVIETHDKTFLVPVGEYLPPVLEAAFTIGSSDVVKGAIGQLFASSRRGNTLEALDYKGTTIGALMCSELLSPYLYRTLVTEHDADVLINVANNSWFNGSHLLYDKLVQIARMHAVENRRYMLVASNRSPSFAIDPNGTTIGATEWDQYAVLLVNVPVAK